MRIAMITGWFLTKKSGSGASVFIQELKTGLEERGLQVDLLTPQFLNVKNYYAATIGRIFKNTFLTNKSVSQYDLVVCFDYDGFNVNAKSGQLKYVCHVVFLRTFNRLKKGRVSFFKHPGLAGTN